MNIANTQTEQGFTLLAQPLLPLVRIIGFLFLTGPFARPSEILDELTEPIEIAGIVYPDPAALLRPFTAELDDLAAIKDECALPFFVTDPNGQAISPMEAVHLAVSHRILVKELERINSLLCGPCRCTLCCTGPDDSLAQLYFEIPLTVQETTQFPLPRIDSLNSRQSRPDGEPPLCQNGAAFYEGDAKLVHWQHGWSMILPRHRKCPHLNETGGCSIYHARPDVCRRPPIFSYLLENGAQESGSTPHFRHQGKLLAVWDCPYVRRFKNEIARFAEMCELEPVFMKNKS